MNTLHEAIIFVLKQSNKPMSFEQIALEIKNKNLWKRKSDNQYPEAFQIRLRTCVQKKYKPLFNQVSETEIQLNSKIKQ